MKTQIRTHISIQDALAAGSTEHGQIIVEPTAEQLATLEAEKRVALAPYVVGAQGSYAHYLTVASPGWTGVVAGLAQAMAEAERESARLAAQIEHERASYRAILAGGIYEPGTMPPARREYPNLWTLAPNYSKADEEATRLWAALEAQGQAEYERMVREADDRLEYDVVSEKLAAPITAVLKAAEGTYCRKPVPAPRAQAFHARLIAERHAAEVARNKAQTDAIREIVAADGAPDQIERLDADVLPERELNALIESRLFAPFAKFEPFIDITEAAVAEECDCDTDEVKFSTSTVEPAELEADEYAILKGLREAAPEGAAVEMREHVGYQKGATGDDDPEIRRNGIRVTIEFAGRKWRREYAM